MRNTYGVYVQDLWPTSQQAFVVVHHVGKVLPIQPGLLLVQTADFLVAFSCSAVLMDFFASSKMGCFLHNFAVKWQTRFLKAFFSDRLKLKL